jgi:hypothetical protein
VGLTGVWSVRRHDWILNPEDNDKASLAHAYAGVVYAVAPGLMVVGAQSDYTEVEMAVMKEAYLAGDLYIDSEGLAGQDGADIRDLTEKYVRCHSKRVAIGRVREFSRTRNTKDYQ